MRAKIIDVSLYQEEIDWQAVAGSSVVAAAIRCTVGNYYTDARFQQNWAGAKAAGLKVTAYHVVTPEYSAQSQIDRFKAALGDRLSDWPLVMDVELSRGQSNSTIVRRVKECLDLTEAWQGQKSVIYTAKWWWDQYMRVDGTYPAWTKDYTLWVAQYPYDPTPPSELDEGAVPTAFPKGWSASDWKIWQWTARGRIPGINANVDLDVFNGTFEEFNAWASREVVAPPPAPGVTRVRVLVQTLNIRSGPGTQYQDLGNLHAGDILEITDLSGTDAWVQIEPGKWAAFKVGNSRFMEVVRE